MPQSALDLDSNGDETAPDTVSFDGSWKKKCQLSSSGVDLRLSRSSVW